MALIALPVAAIAAAAVLAAGLDPNVVVAAIGMLGGVGGLAAWWRAGAERESIAAATLITVNTELRRELERRDEIITDLRRRVRSLERRCRQIERGEA